MAKFQVGDYVKDIRGELNNPSWKITGYSESEKEYILQSIGLQQPIRIFRPEKYLKLDEKLQSESKLKEQLKNHNPNSVKRKRIPVKRYLDKVQTNNRTERLLPNGKPRYVRIYDSGRATGRFVIVFTGRIGTKTNERIYMTMSYPIHVTQILVRKGFIDRPSYIHLGKKITFDDLPDELKPRVLTQYKYLWGIK